MLFFLDNGNTCIYFDRGAFDKYCVYINKCNGSFRHAPKDEEYFDWIRILAQRYGVWQVWNDFCCIYNIVDTGESEDDVFALIISIDMHYNDDTILWWLIFYMTMLAECKKEHTILKKSIKKLGVYNILFDGYTVEYTVEYMKGMRWQDLKKIMIERGI